VAGLFIIYNAIKNLIHPQPLQKLDFGIILVSVTAIINFVSGWICVQRGKKNNSAALVASGEHLKSDTYSTIGIVAGLLLIYLFGWNWLDGAVAIFFALVIMFTGYKIMRSSLAGIMDEADKVLLKKIVALLNQNRRENWVDLHNLRLIKFGDILHLDCHLTVPWYLNVREAHQEVDVLSSLVRKEFGESVELNVHVDGCLDFSCRICNKLNCEARRNDFERRIDWTIENISRDTKHHL
jgi:cation diffusion facilitator family transporter